MPAGQRGHQETDQGKGTTMTRQKILLMTFAAGVILSLSTASRADTKVVVSHSRSGIGVVIGARIGHPVPPPVHYPPMHRPVVVTRPWRHRVIRIGPPVVVHPPVVEVEVVPPPVVREVVVTPPPVEATTITVWITNSNGSKTAVKLTRQGPWYVGPRGEYYTEMPTNEQLRVVYGF